MDINLAVNALVSTSLSAGLGATNAQLFDVTKPKTAAIATAAYHVGGAAALAGINTIAYDVLKNQPLSYAFVGVTAGFLSAKIATQYFKQEIKPKQLINLIALGLLTTISASYCSGGKDLSRAIFPLVPNFQLQAPSGSWNVWFSIY